MGDGLLPAFESPSRLKWRIGGGTWSLMSDVWGTPSHPLGLAEPTSPVDEGARPGHHASQGTHGADSRIQGG
jgi:hypothetical protein